MAITTTPETIAIMPYCFVVEPGENGEPTTTLSVMSELAVRAAVYLQKHRRGSRIALIGEYHPGVDLAATSELARNLAIKMGVQEESITILDDPERPANNTHKQVKRFAEHFLAGGNDEQVLILGWSFHLPRVQRDAWRAGMRGERFGYLSVEGIDRDPAITQSVYKNDEQRRQVSELIAGSLASEAILRLGYRFGLGFLFDALTERLGPRLINVREDGSIIRSHVLPEYQRISVAYKRRNPSA